MALIFDTGPLYATIDTTDRFHGAAMALLRDVREPRLIPSPVLVEADYLISSRLGSHLFVALLDDIDAGAFDIVDLVARDYTRVRELLDQYSDLDIGFVDAAVIAVVERLGEPKLATLDHRHFRTVRPRHVDALQLLPE